MSWKNQIANRNFLSPIGFRMSLPKYPKVTYFSQSANIPAINLDVAEQSTPFGRGIGRDAFLQYEPFTMSFIVDEDLENYLLIHNWMRGLGTPENRGERTDLITAMRDPGDIQGEQVADGILFVLNSNLRANFQVHFYDLFPIALNNIQFNATVDGSEYAQAEVTFRYTSFSIEDLQGNRKKDFD